MVTLFYSLIALQWKVESRSLQTIGLHGFPSPVSAVGFLSDTPSEIQCSKAGTFGMSEREELCLAVHPMTGSEFCLHHLLVAYLEKLYQLLASQLLNL